MSRPLVAAATSTPLRPSLPPLLVAASKNDVASLRTILAALHTEAAQPAPRSVTYLLYCALLIAVRVDALAFARCLLEESVFHIPLQQVRLQGEGEDAEFQTLNAAVQTLSRAQMPVFSDIRNIASALDRTEMSMLLVKARPHEAESMCLSSDGHSPALRCVHLCARDNQPALLGALVDANVDLNAAITGNHRRSPLDRYVLRRASDGDHFISPDIRHPAGSTVLHMACTYRQLDLVQRLLRHPSVIVDVRDVEGNTPLHCSLGANRGARAPSGAADLALIRTLCASGAECTLQNAAGHSVRSLAVRGVSASVPADEAAWPAAVASAWDKVRLACLGGVAMRRTQHEQLMALLLRQESAAVCSSTLPASESAPLAAALVSTAASAPVDAAACALPQPLPEALIALIVDFTLGTAPPSHEALAAALDALSSNPS